jgi:hypothetical protein
MIILTHYNPIIGKDIHYRDCDVRVGNLKDEELIELLYKRLWASNEALEKIKGIVTSSFGTKDITDFNMEILNPLWQVYDKPK